MSKERSIIIDIVSPRVRTVIDVLEETVSYTVFCNDINDEIEKFLKVPLSIKNKKLLATLDVTTIGVVDNYSYSTSDMKFYATVYQGYYSKKILDTDNSLKPSSDDLYLSLLGIYYDTLDFVVKE